MHGLYTVYLMRVAIVYVHIYSLRWSQISCISSYCMENDRILPRFTYFRSDAFMFSPCCLHDVLDGHTDLFITFPTMYWFRIFNMDSSRKKITFKWRRAAVTSPAHVQRGDTGSGTASPLNMLASEDSNASPLNDSAGPDGLGALSLDTPKRKAEVLLGSVPSFGKVRLRELSKKNNEYFMHLKVYLYCKSCFAHCECSFNVLYQN